MVQTQTDELQMTTVPAIFPAILESGAALNQKYHGTIYNQTITA